MKDTTRAAIIAGLAVLAVAFAAATLNSTVTPESSAPGGSAGSDEGGSGGLSPPPQSESPPGETVTLPYLSELLTVLAAIVLLALIVYVIRYRRDTLGLVLGSIALVGLLFVVGQFLSWPIVSPPDPPAMEPGSGPFSGGDGGGGGDAGSDTIQPSPPSVLVLLAFGLVLLGGLVAALGSTDDDSDDSLTDTGDDPTTAAAVGRAAGRAADRLKQAGSVDNEVYRAWREMTDLLDVEDPATSTPREFAGAAVEAGLDREDVDELTRLFEDVRYGDLQPTADHEQRAATVFRRIEDQYTEGDS